MGWIVGRKFFDGPCSNSLSRANSSTLPANNGFRVATIRSQSVNATALELSLPEVANLASTSVLLVIR